MMTELRMKKGACQGALTMLGGKGTALMMTELKIKEEACPRMLNMVLKRNGTY